MFEQAKFHGRIYRTIDNVHAAVREFFERYNATVMLGESLHEASRLTQTCVQ
jgi:hypothetical protein